MRFIKLPVCLPQVYLWRAAVLLTALLLLQGCKLVAPTLPPVERGTPMPTATPSPSPTPKGTPPPLTVLAQHAEVGIDPRRGPFLRVEFWNNTPYNITMEIEAVMLNGYQLTPDMPFKPLGLAVDETYTADLLLEGPDLKMVLNGENLAKELVETIRVAYCWKEGAHTRRETAIWSNKNAKAPKTKVQEGQALLKTDVLEVRVQSVHHQTNGPVEILVWMRSDVTTTAIRFSVVSASVNGQTFHPLFHCDLQPRAAGFGSIDFLQYELLSAGITQIQDIRLVIAAYDLNGPLDTPLATGEEVSVDLGTKGQIVIALDDLMPNQSAADAGWNDLL